MKKLASVLVLMAVVGGGSAGEKEIRKALEDAGVRESRCIVDKERRYDVLIFDGCRSTDALLGELCELRLVLEALDLERSDVTDTGIATIKNLNDLKYLGLRLTAVTDIGLRQLEGLKGLQFLDLYKCPSITDEGVARLQKALPKCQIVR